MSTHTISNTPELAMQGIRHFFEHLQTNDVDRLAEFYTTDARFKDPFNDVQGTVAIARIFDHMFVTLDAPRFVITQQVQQGAQCFVTWDFLFSSSRIRGGATQIIHGATHFVLREEGGVWRVAIHRDYWDAAEELYEKLPVLGGLMRWLKARANS